MDYASSYADAKSLLHISNKYSIPLIYDAAHSSLSANIAAMRISYATMLSFDPIKTLTAIDAGVAIFSDQESSDSARRFRHMGMNQDISVLANNGRSHSYDVAALGFRYHLSNIHAAIGSIQVKRFNEIHHIRTKYTLLLRDSLNPASIIKGWIPVSAGFCPFMNVALIEPQHRDAIMALLDSDYGIQCGIHWKPAQSFSIFESYSHIQLPMTDAFCSSILSLPLFTDMTEEHVAYITASFLEAESRL